MPTKLSRQRLVLLPFKSLASGEANEIFTDGLAVELFSKLSHIRGLQVIDGSSFVKSQGVEKDFAAKWRELNAGALLKGTVLKEQKQLRIRLQLLDSQTQELLKAFDFDREPESVLALQTEAAEFIAAALEVQLLADERLQLSRKPTKNPRAYQVYLEGRAFWSRYTEPGWRRSIELFNEAIRLDPNFALAYAGLADSYVQLSADFMSPREGFGIARTNALRALELQPDLAQVYVSLAQCKMWFDRDYPGAKQAFETALRLEPRYPDTYHFFGHYYECLGEMPRALELYQQAIEYDPLSSVLQAELGWADYHARRYADGAAQCRKVLASDPTFDYARCVLGVTLLQAGQHEEAVQTLETAYKSLGWATVLGDLGYACAVAGKTQQARQVLQQLHAMETNSLWLPPSAIGFVHLGLGQTNEALTQFERAVDLHDVYMAWIKVEPRFDPLRNEPRFQAILKKMNLVTHTPHPKSVAVLPFVNLSADKADEYLSDGISEDLCTALTQVKELRVPAWRSCLGFKGKTDDIRKIGEQLNVATVLAGSVTKAGSKIRVNAQLSDVTNGFQLWAKIYDREMTNILEIRSDIAQQVVAALRVQLGVDEVQRVVKKPTDNPAAYALCLRGRHWVDQGTAEGFTNAVKFFEQTIALDPGYALAYAGLANAYRLASGFVLPGKTAMAAGKTMAEKALILDETLAEAHVAMGMVKLENEWDWSGVEKEYSRAVALAPNLTDPLSLQGRFLMRMGRFEEARVVYRRAWQLDPLSPNSNVRLAIVEFFARDYQTALEVSRTNVAEFPMFLESHVYEALACEQIGQNARAISAMAIARSIEEAPDLMAYHAHMYGSAGETNAALGLQKELEARKSRAYVSPMYFAWVHLGLGQTNEAITKLEQAMEDRDGEIPLLNVHPYYDSIRADPRFIALLRKIGLPR